ncbi:MAG: ABC transporter substrate-binding protein [Chloroflexota bacterium]
MSPFMRHCVAMLLILAGTSTGTAFSQTSQTREWGNTVAAAKKEANLSIYGPHNPAYLRVWEVFRNSFPEINFNFLPGRGSDLAKRILEERRAGKFIVDLVMGGASTYASYPAGVADPIRPLLILPEVKDKSAWWGGQLSFSDPQNQYVINISGQVGINRIAYNTKLVDPNEFRSWRDLLNPKWKGKLVAFDPRATGGGAPIFLFFYHSADLGPEFLRRLFRDMKVALTRDLRQGTDWLADGKYQLYIGSSQPILKAKEQGLPVAFIPHSLKEGEIMGGGACCMAYLNHAPHPNAAKVFINWVLSREGQIAWQKYTETNSLRMDIPKDDLPREWVPQEGVHYFHMSLSKYSNRKDIKSIQRIVTEALEEANK